MKRLNAGSLVAIGAICLSGIVTPTVAAPAMKTRPVVESQGRVEVERALAFRDSLTQAQIDALVAASQGWKRMINQPEALMHRAEQDVARILTPAQAREFMALIEPGISSGGVYRPIICFMNSKLAVLFSMIGLVGCPGGTAEDAMYSAWTASVYSNTCLIEHTESCDLAAYAALDAYAAWSQLTGTCDLADTAMYSCLLTYAGCGGTW